MRASGKVCQTGTQQRSGAHYAKAKAEYVDRGALGQVVFVRAIWSDFPWQRRKIASYRVRISAISSAHAARSGFRVAASRSGPTTPAETPKSWRRVRTPAE